MPFSSLSLFTPTITAGLGYENLQAQLMTVPPYAVAYVVTLAVSWSADYFNAYVFIFTIQTQQAKVVLLTEATVVVFIPQCSL